MTTPKNVLPNWAAAQASPWAIVNQALYDIDQLMNVSVLDVTLIASPGSESDGDAYIVASGAIGNWAGQDNKLAYYINGGYIFKTLPAGTIVFNAADSKHYTWTGATYLEFTGGGGGTIAVDEEGSEILATASRFNFIGGDVSVSDAGFGVADITFTGSGAGSAGGGPWEFKENISTTGGARIDVDVSGYDEVRLILNAYSTDVSSYMIMRFSPDGGATLRDGASDYSILFESGSGTGYSLEAQVDLASGDTTTDQSGFVDISHLSTSTGKTMVQSHIGRVDANQSSFRTGFQSIKEIIDTVVLETASGLFDQMDIDVFVRSGTAGETGHAATDALPDAFKRLGVDGKKYADPALLHGYFVTLQDAGTTEFLVKTGLKSWAKCAYAQNPTLTTYLPFGTIATLPAVGSEVSRVFASELSGSGGYYTGGKADGYGQAKVATNGELQFYYEISGDHYTTVEWVEP